MRTPHKHAELIKLWADGAEIQRMSVAFNDWVEDMNPSWRDAFEYRIKPMEEKKPVVRWLWAWEGATGWHMHTFKTEDEAAKDLGNETYFKLEWSRTEFPD